MPEWLDSSRLDVWLDIACLFKTRSEAQSACKAGKVDVNGQAATPHRRLRAGDTLGIRRGSGRKQIVIVRAFAAHHVKKAAGRLLYEDLTPPPSEEELEQRRLRRLFGQPQPHPSRAPDKRDRRALRRLKRGL